MITRQAAFLSHSQQSAATKLLKILKLVQENLENVRTLDSFVENYITINHFHLIMSKRSKAIKYFYQGIITV